MQRFVMVVAEKCTLQTFVLNRYLYGCLDCLIPLIGFLLLDGDKIN
jgi:hypothetical protein